MLLPPKILGPISDLSTVVVVVNVVEGASVQVFADNNPISGFVAATGPSVSVPLTGHIFAGQSVTATQSNATEGSTPSPPERVLLAAPELTPVAFFSNPTPCVDWIMVGNVFPGATVTIMAKNIIIGTGQAVGNVISVPIKFPTPASPGDVLQAFQSKGPGSLGSPLTPSLPLGPTPPSVLPGLTIAPVASCDISALVSGLMDGMSLILQHNDKTLSGFPYAGTPIWATLDKPAAIGDTLAAWQESNGCGRRSVPSSPQTVSSPPNLDIPAIAGPVCPGATLLHVSNLRIGADIDVWVEKNEGPGSGTGANLGSGRAWAAECDFPLPYGWQDPAPSLSGTLQLKLTESSCGSSAATSIDVAALSGHPEKPSIQPAPMECATVVMATGLTPGATVQLISDQPEYLSPELFVVSSRMPISTSRPLRLNENLHLQQSGCGVDIESAPTPVLSMDLSKPPKLDPISIPDGGATFKDVIIGARLYVYQQGNLVANVAVNSDPMFVPLPVMRGEVWGKEGLCTQYSADSQHQTVQEGKLIVTQNPSLITRNVATMVTIWAKDAESGNPVNGNVYVSGKVAGSTGTPFSVTATGPSTPAAYVDATPAGYGLANISWQIQDPPAKLHLAVNNQSQKPNALTIVVVNWTIYQLQGDAKWHSYKSSSGSPAAITIEGPTGTFLIVPDVSVTDKDGNTLDAQFSGTGVDPTSVGTDPDGKSGLTIFWSGVDSSRIFDLLAVTDENGAVVAELLLQP